MRDAQGQSSFRWDQVMARLAAGPEPLEGLAELRQLRAELDRLQEAYVRRARQAGASWTEVGYHLGVSAQAAHKRYGAG